MKTYFYTLIFSFVVLQAQATNYYSTTNGSWEGTVWSTVDHSSTATDILPCKFSGNDSVFIQHSITSSCTALELGKASGSTVITILPGGTFEAFGSVSLSGTHLSVIQSGSTFNIHGDLTMTGTSDIVVDGILQVFGDVTMSGRSRVCGSGSASYTGTLNLSGNAEWCDLLPVEFESVSASITTDKDVAIEWVTASETNNAFFTVERSYDGLNFETVTYVEGQGTTSLQQRYTITDNLPAEANTQNWVYYRIKQTDTDGSFAYSKVVVLAISELQATQDIQVYPNPTQHIFHVETALNLQNGQIMVYNSNGTLVAQQGLNGINRNYSFDTSNWAVGMYVVVIQTDKYRIPKKVVVQ